jgi:hypothetical protein
MPEVTGPHPARVVSGQEVIDGSWFYGDPTGITIIASSATTYGCAHIRISRRQLAAYLKRTEPPHA